jgi:hypothetical protein
MDLPPTYREPGRAARIACIARSFARLLGRPLITGGDTVEALWEAPDPIVAHGTEDDPVFFFGNRAALTAFECDVAAFTAMPSRLSAEAPLRAERQALMQRVATQGFVDDYRGVRISAKGTRFRMTSGVVWNVSDDAGERVGQAATFTPASLA